eukprot:Gregarina_sp_Poly_1__5625@NODE_296_length_9847_cov_43_256544_g256_i0_p2_GENE_NODE_296_length_9847_cov_43_256544_g256_i0NODE_296_length_9847_cov_43_256544_g256_i0_p2_ORF_typecomplete_len630_score107_51Arteri_nsp7a/PF16749_5/0_086_NODE_296_length_9847_cov_43_256544_g256_i046526541
MAGLESVDVEGDGISNECVFLLTRILAVLTEERWELLAIFKTEESEVNSSTGDPATPQAEVTQRTQIKYLLNELLLCQFQIHEWNVDTSIVDLRVWSDAVDVSAALSDLATASYNTEWHNKLEILTQKIADQFRALRMRLDSFSDNRELRLKAGVAMSLLCIRHMTSGFPDAILSIAECRKEMCHVTPRNLYHYHGEPESDEIVWSALTYLLLEYQTTSQTNKDFFSEDSYRNLIRSILDDVLAINQQTSATWAQKFYSATTFLCAISCLVVESPDELLKIPDELRTLWSPVIKISGMLMNMLDVGFGNRVRRNGDVKFSVPQCAYDLSPPIEKTHYQFPSANVSPYLFGTDMDTTSLCLLGIRLLIHAIGVLGGHRGASAYGAEVPVIELHQSMIIKLEATFSEIVVDQAHTKFRASLLLKSTVDLWIEIVLWIRTNIPKNSMVDIVHHWNEDFVARFLKLVADYFLSIDNPSSSTALDHADICHRLWRLCDVAVWPTGCQQLIEHILKTHPVTHILVEHKRGKNVQDLIAKDPQMLMAEIRRVPFGLRYDFKKHIDNSVDVSKDFSRYQDAVRLPNTGQLQRENDVSIVLSLNNNFSIEVEDEDLSANVPISNLHSIYYELEQLSLK